MIVNILFSAWLLIGMVLGAWFGGAAIGIGSAVLLLVVGLPVSEVALYATSTGYLAIAVLLILAVTKWFEVIND